MRDRQQRADAAMDGAENPSNRGPFENRRVGIAVVHVLADVGNGLHRIAEALYTLAPGYNYPIARDPVGWRALLPEDVHEGHYGRRVIIRADLSGTGWRGRLLLIQRTQSGYSASGQAWIFMLHVEGDVDPHAVTLPTDGNVTVEVEREDTP